MNKVLPGASVDPANSKEEFLSGAYRRILWIALALGTGAALGATVLVNWRSGLGLGIGAILACLNFVWLHHGAELMIRRMVEPTPQGLSKFRLLLAFTLRYAFVIAVAYVILSGYPQVRLAFIVGLACPVIAAMGEGLYEAVRPQQTSKD